MFFRHYIPVCINTYLVCRFAEYLRTNHVRLKMYPKNIHKGNMSSAMSGMYADGRKYAPRLAAATAKANESPNNKAPVLYPVRNFLLHFPHVKMLSIPIIQIKGVLTVLPHPVHLKFRVGIILIGSITCRLWCLKNRLYLRSGLLRDNGIAAKRPFRKQTAETLYAIRFPD